MSVQDEIANNGLNPIYGFATDDGYIVDKYRGFKGGAVLALFARNENNELCVAIISETKFDGKVPQCNLIEGMRNGPDLKVDFSNAVRNLTGDRKADNIIKRDELERQGHDLTDRDAAYRECLEECGIDLKEIGVDVDKVDYKLPDGREHLNIHGGQDNYVLQNVSFFVAELPKTIGLTQLKPENDNAMINWVRLQDIQINKDGCSASVINDHELEGGLDSIQLGAIMQSAEHVAKKALDSAYENTLLDPRKCASTFPDTPEQVDGWMSAELAKAEHLKHAFIGSPLVSHPQSNKRAL